MEKKKEKTYSLFFLFSNEKEVSEQGCSQICQLWTIFLISKENLPKSNILSKFTYDLLSFIHFYKQ